MDVRKQERCNTLFNKKNSQIIEKFSIIKDVNDFLTTSITRFFTALYT